MKSLRISCQLFLYHTTFTLFGQMKTGTLRRGKAVQGGMKADKVVEKDEHGSKVIGGREGRISLFSLVIGPELLDELLNEVVGDVILKTLHADMLDPMQCLDRHSVGRIAVAHSGLRIL